MTKASTSLLRWCRKGLLSLLACGGVLSNLLVVGIVGAPLALVSPPAMASCSFSGDPTTQTYTYSAATLYQDAPLQFSGEWTCTQDSWPYSQGNSAYICYESTFDGTAAYNTNTIPYTVGFTDGTNAVNPMTSGRWYGVYTNPYPGQSQEVKTTFTVTVPANAAAGMPAGTYSDNSIQFQMDEQGNNTGLNNCEKSGGGGGGWDSGSVTYRVRFKVPASCALVSTPTIDFGNLNVGPVPAGGVVANGGIVVKCTSGTPYTVYLGDGNQRITGGGYRQMANGSARLAYQLYKNSAHTQIWDATGGTGSVGGSGGQSSTGTGASQTWTVYGWIPTGVTVPGTTGTYTDTVVVTVTY